MAKGKELFTFSVRLYDEGGEWGWRWLSHKDRFALDLGRISFIFELWWIRGGLCWE